jgi:hypothetical protein
LRALKKLRKINQELYYAARDRHYERFPVEQEDESDVERRPALWIQCETCGKGYEYRDFIDHRNTCIGHPYPQPRITELQLAAQIEKRKQDNRRKFLKQIQQVALRPGGWLYQQALQDFNARLYSNP